MTFIVCEAKLAKELANGMMNRPGFTGGRLAQMLGCIFGLVQAFIESFLRFVWRDVSDGTV